MYCIIGKALKTEYCAPKFHFINDTAGLFGEAGQLPAVSHIDPGEGQ